MCLIITLGQNYQAFLQDRIDWGGVVATYVGIPLFLLIWLGIAWCARFFDQPSPPDMRGRIARAPAREYLGELRGGAVTEIGADQQAPA